MRTDTPPEIDETVMRLCKSIVPNACPIYVPCVPETYSERDDCFFNVEEKIKRDGGSKLHGWQIWLWPGVLIEAEFHAIWRSPSQDEIDITPKDLTTDRILFLPDPGRTYAGKDIDNIRTPLSEGQIVKDFIALTKARFILIQRGRVHGSKEVSLDREEYESLASARLLCLHMVENQLSRNSLCPCGSNEKYKRCHERQFERIKKHFGIAS